MVAISAAQGANVGASLEEVIDIVRNSMTLVDFRLAFDTLEYLKRGGRMGTAQAFFGSALKVNPILTIKNGVTEGVARVRSREKAIDYLVDFVTGFPDIGELAIEDATTPAESEMLAKRLESKFSSDRIYWMKVGPVIGTHVGPHVLGVGVLPAK